MTIDQEHCNLVRYEHCYADQTVSFYVGDNDNNECLSKSFNSAYSSSGSDSSKRLSDASKMRLRTESNSSNSSNSYGMELKLCCMIGSSYSRLLETTVEEGHVIKSHQLGKALSLTSPIPVYDVYRDMTKEQIIRRPSLTYSVNCGDSPEEVNTVFRQVCKFQEKYLLLVSSDAMYCIDPNECLVVFKLNMVSEGFVNVFGNSILFVNSQGNMVRLTLVATDVALISLHSMNLLQSCAHLAAHNMDIFERAPVLKKIKNVLIRDIQPYLDLVPEVTKPSDSANLKSYKFIVHKEMSEEQLQNPKSITINVKETLPFDIFEDNINETEWQCPKSDTNDAGNSLLIPNNEISLSKIITRNVSSPNLSVILEQESIPVENNAKQIVLRATDPQIISETDPPATDLQRIIKSDPLKSDDKTSAGSPTIPQILGTRELYLSSSVSYGRFPRPMHAGISCGGRNFASGNCL